MRDSVWSWPARSLLTGAQGAMRKSKFRRGLTSGGGISRGGAEVLQFGGGDGGSVGEAFGDDGVEVLEVAAVDGCGFAATMGE